MTLHSLALLLAATLATAPDSLWLRWQAPAVLSDGVTPARDPQTQYVLRTKPQASAWRPGCERVAACWDSVRRESAPDTLGRLLRVWPGSACAWRVAAADSDSVAVVAANGRGPTRWMFTK